MNCSYAKAMHRSTASAGSALSGEWIASSRWCVGTATAQATVRGSRGACKGVAEHRRGAMRLARHSGRRQAMKQFVSRGSRWVVLALLLGLVALPARGVEQPERPSSQPTHLSQGVLLRRWLAQPNQAPEQLQARFQAAHDQLAAARKTEAA